MVDATGVRAGLSSFLKATLGARRGTHPAVQVVPFLFTAASKSRLGWDFLGLIDSGRFKEYASVLAQPDPCTVAAAPAMRAPPVPQRAELDRITAEYLAQLRATTYEVLNGPGNTSAGPSPPVMATTTL